MHHDYLDLLKEKKLLEFNWDMFGKGNSNKNILTHVLALHYGYTQFLQDLEDNVGIVLPKFIYQKNRIQILFLPLKKFH